jgi:mannose-1-phosphate guanylyltransferase/mannose-6-phosphate isomerase
MVNFVVLCGGSGSRLWPKSREKLPKQFLSLTNDFTMFQNTVQRISFVDSKITSKNKLIIICSKDHIHLVELQLAGISLSIDHEIICEPRGRDSAPAICIASLLGFKTDYTIVLPCDHEMDNEEFSKCCLKSFDYLENSIVTFGIEPTTPETGYGYIQTNDEFQTLQFIEKPNLETAKKYLEQGGFLWNAGIFAFKNGNMIACFEKYAPDILENCILTIKNTVFSTTNNKNNSTILFSPFFSICRAISIDYAIMEKLCSDSEAILKSYTFPYQSYWNDIGSYLALYQQLEKEKDENNNVLKGNIFTIDTKNSYIESGEKMVATIGIQDLIIVNTDDALLICNNQKTQEVKKVVEFLKKEKREEYLLHKKVFRQWGYYKNVEGTDNSGFKIKKIAVYPGKRLSLQSHDHRSEHWVIAKGKAKVQVGTEELILEKDEHVYIPVKALHRIENIGTDLMEFTETQIGDYLGEDDIIRYEDDFGRV